MSLTTHHKSSCPTPTFNEQSYPTYFHQYQEMLVVITLLGSLYGVLTILSVISLYALLQRRSGKIQPTAIILCLTILALFSSTTTYVVTCILYDQAALMGSSSEFCYSIMSAPGEPRVGPPNVLLQLFSHRFELQACASAGTLAVNVILGDAIVWWRACVVWHENRVVKTICGVFIVATLALGVVDTYQSCGLLYPLVEFEDDGKIRMLGVLFEGIPIGVATCVLSLGTNILATVLVAYKAWQSRVRFKEYLVTKVGGSQLEKLLALLIESGAIYSAIWSVVVAFQVSRYTTSHNVDPLATISAVESNFIKHFGVFMDGALVPAIAIYPTIIIVLVTFNRSHMERGISQHLESMPTPDLALTVNTIPTGLHESHYGYRRSEVLVVDGQGLGCGDGAARRTSEERKAEGTV